MSELGLDLEVKSSKPTIVLDASLLDLFTLCEYKYNIRHNLLKVPDKAADPLTRGAIIHSGKEAYFNALKAGKDWTTAVSEQLAAAKLIGLQSDIIQIEDSKNHITLDFLLETLERESTYHKTADLSMEIHAVEEAIAFELYEDEDLKIVLIGKIDLLASMKGYSNIPFDHKSSVRSTTLHRIRNQFSLYAYALKSGYLFVNQIGLQKTLKDSERFKRSPLSYDSIFLEQWKANAIKWCKRYYDCHVTGEWLQNLTSCDKFNRDCEYLPICETSGEEGKVFKLDTFYATGEKWDVSKSLSYKRE